MPGREPGPEEWLAVGNDMRAVMGLPLVGEASRIPTEEELAAYDRICPGAADTLREMAREEARHRDSLAGNRSLSRWAVSLAKLRKVMRWA